MDTHRIISNQLSQYVFEREPPYKKEAILKALGKDVNVEYNLKKVEQQIKTVTDPDKKEDLNLLTKEKVAESISKILNKNENFISKTVEEQNIVIADLINGKYDVDIFENDDKII